MTEAEIIEQISEIIDRLWVIQQWWASVSFGVLIIAHVASEKLNGFTVALILFLYTVYSVYVNEILGLSSDVLASFIADLEGLAESGSLVTEGAAAYIKQPRYSPILVPIALYGTYVSAVAYLVFGYFRGRSAKNA